MVTSRLALGSVSTLAAAALLLGAAPLVFNHAWTSSSPSPWGTLSSFSGSLSTTTPSDGDRSQLLKLAALKSGKTDAASDPAMTAAAQLAAVPAAPSGPSPAVASASPATPGATDLAPAGSTTIEQAPVVMASADVSTTDGEAESIPLPPAAPARSTSALININRATMDALDHFPGAGHIGHAIVSHRPYRSIADLVKKRVLRTSDFQKIQGRISVD